MGAAKSVTNGITHLDGTGKHISLPFADIHAHFRDPGFESKEEIASGLRAAARGGFSDVCVMPNTSPVNDEPHLCTYMLERAREVPGANLYPIAAISKGQLGVELAEFARLKEAGAVAFSDDGKCVMSASLMRRALEYAKTVDLPIIQHAEDHHLTAGAEMHEGAVSTRLGLRGWPSVAEDIIVARDFLLTDYVKGRYHLAHVSTKGAVELLREAKRRGLNVTAEVTPHHLLLTHESIQTHGAMAKVNPPLREESDRAALIEALRDGTIDCVATDHAPHGAREKSCLVRDAAMGMIGIEFAFSLLLSLVEKKLLTLERLIETLTVGPRRALRLPTPILAEGELASLVIFDVHAPIQIESVESKSKNTPFLGQNFRGKVMATVSKGHTLFGHDWLRGK